MFQELRIKINHEKRDAERIVAKKKKYISPAEL